MGLKHLPSSYLCKVTEDQMMIYLIHSHGCCRITNSSIRMNHYSIQWSSKIPKFASSVLFDTLVEKYEGTYDRSTKFGVLCTRTCSHQIIFSVAKSLQSAILSSHGKSLCIPSFAPFFFGIEEKGHSMVKYGKALGFDKNDDFAIPF
eukprot:TRINITY_DN8302_c0_g11_i1.p1 TRINITY_DN8302_c0_g11~~TRINITY_DN8302_c0_g11_i1.p1  ORF type:complete len:147 (+),score=20.43 TRINITY_DN8302_c0_g11_i1:518-958(+)